MAAKQSSQMASTAERTTRQTGAGRQITFEYFAPKSKEVQIAGTFNGWRPIRLMKSGEGKWATTLDLKPGRYEYRYLVDGAWQNDQRSVECVPNSFGSWNCIAEVK